MITLEDMEALGDFLDAREGARKFHPDRIGKGVNPDRCLADFLVAVRADDRARLSKVYGVERTKAAMAEHSGTLGGYLVPAELRTELYQTVEEEAIVRPRATVVPAGSKSLLLPYPASETAQSAGVPPYFGGVSLAWTQEAATRTETEPAWKQKEVMVWDLSGYALASNPLLQDAADGTEAYLRTLFGRAIAWHEDYAFLRGDGVGKPVGALTRAIADGASVTRATGTDFKFADAQSMIGKLLPGSWPTAVWVLHVLAVPKLVALATSTTVVWQANQGPYGPGGPVGWLFNMPVFVTDKLPALGTAGDVILFDPRLYVIADRRADLEIAFSPHEPTAFLKNQSAFRIVFRVGGEPWLSGGVTIADATNVCYQAVYLS